MSLLETLKAGGFVMWPLAICSLVSLAIIIERSINLRRSKILIPAIVERVTGLVEGGRADRALQICRENPGIYTHVVMAGLEQAPKGEAAAKQAVEDAGRYESTRLSRNLGALGTIVGISPLLGLLGTVTGMIEVFRTIADVGAGHANQLSGGISQALVTTAVGLTIAIPSLVAYNYFQGKVESIIADLESETLRVLHVMYGYRAPAEGREVEPGERATAVAGE
jgi:biopolymer transport protein ExbB